MKALLVAGLLSTLAAPIWATAPEPQRTPPPPIASEQHPKNPSGLSAAEMRELVLSARAEKVRRAAKAKDILAWGKLLFPDKFPLPFCDELHGYLIEIRDEDFTNTEAPRFHAKTTIKCFLIPIFQALEEPDAFRYYLNIQATDKKALAVNRAIKTELESNELLREVYGDQIGERWTDAEFVTKKGIVFAAVSAGQSIRGLNYNNIRPDYLVVDDLYDEDDINNPESTEKKNDWFWGTLYPARSPSRRCSVHVQGTAINTYDILHKLKEDKTVKSRSFSAVKDWTTGEVLWKDFKPVEFWIAERTRMGSLIFSREFQNERRDDATSIVKKAWLEGWEFDPADLDLKSIKHQLVQVRLGNDPSIGDNLDSDLTGFALVWVTRYADARDVEYWIMGLWNERLTLNGRIELTQRIQDGQEKDRKIGSARVEAVAGFDDYAKELARRSTVPVRRIKTPKDKITNLENKSHYFENRKVHISKNLPAAIRKEIFDQLTINKPKHDDLRDALLLTMDENSGASWTTFVG